MFIYNYNCIVTYPVMNQIVFLRRCSKASSRDEMCVDELAGGDADLNDFPDLGLGGVCDLEYPEDDLGLCIHNLSDLYNSNTIQFTLGAR